MKTSRIAFALTAAVPTLCSAALFYGGDYDGRNALANYVNGEHGGTGKTYDDFNVSGGPVTVTSVWSNNLVDGMTFGSAEVEIRTGVTSGNGGTVVFSGAFPCTLTNTGRTIFGQPEKQVRVSGLSFNLSPGTYFLSVAPVGSGSGVAFVSTTSGANAAGAPIANGNSFINGSPSSYNWSSTSFLGPGNWDFSMGVDTQTLVRVGPTSFSMLRGIVLSGGLPELQNSDDQRLVMRPGIVFSTSEPPVQVVLESSAPAGTVSELHFLLEASTNQASLSQKIELWNFTTSAYETLDTRAATTMDSTTEVSIAANPTRFIEAGTGAMRAKVGYIATGPIFSYPWQARIDQAAWAIYR